MSKKKYKLTVCQNNPNFFSSQDFVEQKLKYDLEMVKNYPGHQKYGFMKVVENNFDEIAFINLTDPHFFGDGFNDERCTLALDWIKGVANAKVVYGGDVFDMATLSGKTNPHQSVLNNASSIDLATSNHYIGKIASKTICGVGGNHDAAYANRLRDVGISPLKYALEKHGIQYFENNALIQIKVGEHYYNILLTHAGSGRNPLDGGAKFVKDFISRTGIKIDALFLGHSHVSAHCIYPYQYKFHDDNGKLLSIIDHQIQIFVDPSFQGENEHFLSKNIDRSSTNAMVTILAERENPYHTSEDKKQFPYILEVKRFPLLKENSNEYTTPAKLYSEKMPDPNKKIHKEIDQIMKESDTKNRIHQATGIIRTVLKKGGNHNGR
jgi:hypothetical protein